MSNRPVVFDEVRGHVEEALAQVDLAENPTGLYVVRDLFGKVGLSVSDEVRSDPLEEALARLAAALEERLGAHGRSAERAVLWVDPELLDEMRGTARELVPGVFWVDRLMVGGDWWTVGQRRARNKPARYTLYSVKGGMGRSTTAAVLAWELARRGEHVLAVDLDLESPGLASAVLEEEAQPRFGVLDWFVEELVGQGKAVLEDMVATPAWAQDAAGSVWVAPAHGRNPQEYLAKLGRAYMDTVADPWTARLQRLLEWWETSLDPTVVLVESRSGLHDIAAATVTDIDAEVMLFAVDSPSAWTGYEILFRHWQQQGLTTRIRDRLSVVSALTPAPDTEYPDRFRENAWDLFRRYIYDSESAAANAPAAVSHILSEEDAPHDPFVVHWNRGLTSGASLRHFEKSTVAAAYSHFLPRFERFHQARRASAERLDSRSPGEVGLTAAVSATHGGRETTRIALSELPDGTSHGSPPRPGELYLPPSHRKALNPNATLVTGMRGSGKTFWWAALQDPSTRTLVAQLALPRLNWIAQSDVRPGFGVKEEPDRYPGRDELRTMMVTDGVDPRDIWRTVHARHLARVDHPLRTLESWNERARYLKDNPGEVSRLFDECDQELERQQRYSLVVFDGLDRSADEWPDMFALIRGLLRHALDMRSYRRIRAKVFLRSDQADEEKVADFPDASKILASAAQLRWPRRDLYGMLWQYLANGPQGEQLRAWLLKGDWRTAEAGGQRVFIAPSVLVASEEVQREKFHAFSGPWMGTDPRRGFPYTWIPNHLGDADGRVSPRSFLAALREAAGDTADYYTEHDYALHYNSVKRGVQKASQIRVRELREDYPWVHRLLEPLAGIVVPCPLKDIEWIWKRDHIFDEISSQIDADDVKLPPRNLDRGAAGLREDLEALGVFRRLRDGRVNIPDVYRIGYGIGRKGGVRPVA